MTSALEPIGMRTAASPSATCCGGRSSGKEERISAATALRLGLVTEVVPREELWPRADEIAKLIGGQPPTAIQGTVKAIWESLDMTRTRRCRRAWPTPRSATPDQRPPAAPEAKADVALTGPKRGYCF